VVVDPVRGGVWLGGVWSPAGLSGAFGWRCVTEISGSARSRSWSMTPNSAAWSTTGPAIDVVPSCCRLIVRPSSRSL
jgi:hypothetical protein